jgi:O-antigen/teichoic acid export membrane protein
MLPLSNVFHGGLWRVQKFAEVKLRRDDLTANSLAMMATTVSNSGLGYVFWVVAARRFSPEQVGAATAIISAATIAATICDLGLRTTLMQELPQTRSGLAWSSRISTGLIIGGVSSAIGGCFAWLVVSLLSKQVDGLVEGLWPIGVIALTMALTLSTMLDGVSTAEKRADQILTRNVVIATSKLALLTVAAFVLSAPTQAVFVSAAIGTVVGVAYTLHWQLRSLHPDWSFTTTGTLESFRVLRGSLVGHHITNLGGWLPPFVLPLEVVILLGTRQNAYFTITWLIGNVFFMVSPSVASALFVAGRWDPAGQPDLTRRAAKLIAFLLTPIALVLGIGGHFILSIFGPGYATFGYPLLLVLIASALPDAITNVRIGQLRAQRRLGEAARLNAVMAVIAIVAAWFLLPVLGIVGGGIAWLVAQTCGSIWVAVHSLFHRRIVSPSPEPVAGP